MHRRDALGHVLVVSCFPLPHINGIQHSDALSVSFSSPLRVDAV